jgi:hypothetical protein
MSEKTVKPVVSPEDEVNIEFALYAKYIEKIQAGLEPTKSEKEAYLRAVERGKQKEEPGKAEAFTLSAMEATDARAWLRGLGMTAETAKKTVQRFDAKGGASAPPWGDAVALGAWYVKFYSPKLPEWLGSAMASAKAPPAVAPRVSNAQANSQPKSPMEMAADALKDVEAEESAIQQMDNPAQKAVALAAIRSSKSRALRDYLAIRDADSEIVAAAEKLRAEDDLAHRLQARRYADAIKTLMTSDAVREQLQTVLSDAVKWRAAVEEIIDEAKRRYAVQNPVII